MPELKPAGFFGAIASHFRPKQLTVHLRMKVLPGGEVEFTPIYQIDGKEIAPPQLGEAPVQKILGYTVAINPEIRWVQRRTGGCPIRVTKQKAVELLGTARWAGVRVASGDQTRSPRITPVHFNLTLALDSKDTLDVEAGLTSADGAVVEKPTSLIQLRRDDGWFAVGDDLLKLRITGTAFDRLMIRGNNRLRLFGEDVPGFLQSIDRYARDLGEVRKNETLRPLSVFGESVKPRVTIVGDNDAIAVETALVFMDRLNRECVLGEDQLRERETTKKAFLRVAEGWVEIPQEELDRYRHSRKELKKKLPGLADIRETAIPTVISLLLKSMRKEGGWTTAWSVNQTPAVEKAHRLVEDPAAVLFRLNLVERGGRSLLALEPVYVHDGRRFAHVDLVASVETGVQWIRLGHSWIRVDRDKVKQISKALAELGLKTSADGFTFPASERERVLSRLALLGSFENSPQYAEFLTKLADFMKIEDVPLPLSLRGEIILRPYQRHGYNWLTFLHRFGLNGILADDMGLGKTLQSLAAIFRANEQSDHPLSALIICPTSVVSNWQAEADKFFSDCYVSLYVGASRQAKLRDALGRLESGANTNVLVVTSYDIARRDCDRLAEVSWLYVVVDEGHHIRNPDAERTKAIKSINGMNKLILTGTPVQNKLEDLWSLFDFTMPGMLGNRKQFREQFGKMDQINWNAIAVGNTSLKERIHPFVLRRLKENVATDLPPKIVITHAVELSPTQLRLYREVLEGADVQRLFDAVEQDGVARSKIFILAAYTKLRAICNHPALVGEATDSPRFDESGKLDELKELIEECKNAGHRVLLFSQSTRMLDIIERFFAEWQVTTLRLDGSTPANRRPELVDEFNGNSAIACFLISTRAGGTGLNLTGADTVIFYDHDWNPANDNQAQDRAYRIGQTKPVTVYKLVSKGTIEEKIIERQAIKQTLADKIVGEDETGFKDLTKDELVQLFKLDDSGE